MAAPALLGLLHAGASFSWLSFSVHPSTVIGLIALAALYEWRARRIPGELDGRRRSFLYAGLLTIFLSLNGPLHDLSDEYLFSAHMVQYLVLTLVAPPLYNTAMALHWCTSSSTSPSW